MDDAQPEAAADGAAGEEPGKKKRPGLLYKLALASVGSVMLAQEELTSFFRRAPEGPAADEVPEEESSEEQAPLPLEPTPEASDWLDATINQVLKTLCVASRDEVLALQREVDALSARLADLRAAD